MGAALLSLASLGMNRRFAPLLGGVASVLLASCVSLSWERTWVNTPLAEEAVEELVPGEANLGACLTTLGAPLYVWEINRSAYAIAYGWNDGYGWGVRVSIATDASVSVAGDFESMNLDLYGVVFAFDREDRLLWRREGHLRDIAYGLERTRPLVPVEEAEETTDH